MSNDNNMQIMPASYLSVAIESAFGAIMWEEEILQKVSTLQIGYISKGL